MPDGALKRVLWLDPTGGHRPGGPTPSVDGDSSWGAVAVDRASSVEEARELLGTGQYAALVLHVDVDEFVARAQDGTWAPLLRDVATIVVASVDDGPNALRLLHAGVQDVLDHHAATSVAMARAVHFAIARKAVEIEARKTWSTDLDTGLPNRAQLIEHLAQLLALRKRHPSTMALIVLRIDGFDAVAASQGQAAAQVLRRKVAVRIRAAVRASDIVAALGSQQFALLLAKLEAPADAHRVALKLSRLLREPFGVLGAAVGVQAHAGVAIYPNDGDDPDHLLRRAVAAALTAERRKQGAANDPG